MKWLSVVAWMAIVVSGEAGMNSEARFDLINTSFGEPGIVRDQESYYVVDNPSVGGTTSASKEDVAAAQAAVDKSLQAAGDDTQGYIPRHQANFAQRHPWWTTAGGVAATAGILSWGHDNQGWFSRSGSSTPDPVSQDSSDHSASVTTGNNSPVTITISTVTTSG